MITPQQASDRWLKGMQSAETRSKIEQGVDAVQVSPGQSAAAAADKWQQSVSSSDAKDKFQRRSASLSVSDWRSAVKKKGLARVGTGALEAKPKVDRVMQQLIPQIMANAEAVRAMPSTTDADRFQRMVRMYELNKQIQIQ